MTISDERFVVNGWSDDAADVGSDSEETASSSSESDPTSSAPGPDVGGVGAAGGDDAELTSVERAGLEGDGGAEVAGPPEPEQPAADDQTVARLEEAAELLPAVMRVAAFAWLRAAAWGAGTSLRISARLARAATDPDAAADLYSDMAQGLRAYAREFLGITDIDDRMRLLTPLAGSALPQNRPRQQIEELRAQGEELLRQAADVGFEEDVHPAYARILSELAPDEARILRLLALDGPQAIVDVRANNLIGLGSQLIAPGLNMIGAQAGLRHRERVPAYVSNLTRLGLVFVSDEPMDDAIAYQVLEAQPEVLSVIKETTRAKTIHRSVQLTPFGHDFCNVCLPLDQGMLPPAPEPRQLPRGG